MNPWTQVWAHVEGLANSEGDGTLVLGRKACPALIAWHNQVVEAKNQTVRENHELNQRLLELQNRRPA